MASAKDTRPEGLNSSSFSPSSLSSHVPLFARPDTLLDVPCQAALQRPSVFWGQQVDLHVVVHQPLQGYPPWLNTKMVADLLCDNDLAFLAYYMNHGITSHNLVVLYDNMCETGRQGHPR